jgi:hypothetical protein
MTSSGELTIFSHEPSQGKDTIMDILRRGGFNFDPVASVKKAIEAWKPGKLESEKEYELSLYNFLHEYYDEFEITKQYAIGQTRADIKVRDEVIIEIKKDLNSKGGYDRLMGQLQEYKKWKGSILLLLIGKTEPNLRKRLLKEAGGDFFVDRKFTIVEK